MKQLIYLLCILSLCSCSVVKKTFSKKQTSIDSTGVKTSSFIDVKKKDSTGAAKNVSNTSKNLDSAYQKTTLVKEYFGDEFDFEGATKDPAEDTAKTEVLTDSTKTIRIKVSGNGTLKYREITITERGNKHSSETAQETTAQKSKVQSTDSTKGDTTQAGHVTSNQTTQDKNVSKTKAFGGWGVAFVIVAVLGLALYLFFLYFRKRQQ